MIVPSIDISEGRTVQLIGGRELALDAGDPLAWLDRFSVTGEVAIVDLDAAMGTGDQRRMITEMCSRATCRIGGGIRDLDQALYWLNAGAHKIVIGTAADVDLLARLPRTRTIAALDAIDGEVVVDGWRRRTGRSVLERIAELRAHVGGFLVTFVEREGRMVGIDPDAIAALVEAAGDARLTIAGGITTPNDIAVIDRLGADAQVGMALYTGRLSLADAFGAPLTSDRADGLFATVVADERGVALGLAWSSADSLRRAIDERRGVYHSRTRGTWVKGATSGATQELLRVDLDCDRDTLRFTVRQRKPGFCHNGTATCWGHGAGTFALETTLADRHVNDVPGSYTQRLWNDPELLGNKLMEEAGELVRASTRSQVVNEAADLLYFSMVRLRGSGASLIDVDAELNRRALVVTRRPGDAKVALPQSSSDSPFSALRVVTPNTLPPRVDSALDPDTMAQAGIIVDSVRSGGDRALAGYARRFDDWRGGDSLVLGRSELQAAEDGLDPATRELIARAATRIKRFAIAQRASVVGLELEIEGGRAGHDIVPVQRAGCYAPAGRFSLPSSLLMTVVTARAAGVSEVWVATPHPSPLMLAAASIAGASGVIAAGGAHAIAALAYGTESIAACDIVVGPGSRWVTAAKRHVAGDVAIDFLAGPSELVVVADSSADANEVAADLLAQAEHDADALPILVTTDAAVIRAVCQGIERQLDSLPTAATARQALRNGYSVLCADTDEVVRTVDLLAPEHLQLSVEDPGALAARVGHAGALFLGPRSAEVFGDYGAGPNHVLPTGRAARHTGGLSVIHFLRIRTWLDINAPGTLTSDTAAFARLEGLEAHARAAERRSS